MARQTLTLSNSVNPHPPTYTQLEGIDYQETFAPVVKPTSDRILNALAAVHKYRIRQFDISNAYLYGPLQEEIYMQQPHGFVISGMVCRMKKALYGLKQSARQWNEKLVEVIKSF